ncbi:MAG: SGNH/GDSL hydrolase family protein [Saprospiraceae bacterium]|nr:SGNH/GDSL hydrolase family protein [Candidatus Opimibacter iunctus]
MKFLYLFTALSILSMINVPEVEGQDNYDPNDWANLNYYKSANAALTPITNHGDRVIFMGNSITEGWLKADPAFFTGKPYVNRGISGQTTPQMLIRFRQDVIDLQPKVVVLLAGTNDIAENRGPTTLEAIYENIVSMAELAKVHNIRMVLCAVLPVYDYPWRPGLQPADKIYRLNKMLEAYCRQQDIVYVDYHTPMSDERKGLQKIYGEDGVHPNLTGYRFMEPLVEAGIAEALKRK